MASYEPAEWYEVLDFIEMLYGRLGDHELEVQINELLIQFGIGWKVLNGQIELRGDEPFEQSIQNARVALQNSGRLTAKAELDEAMLVVSSLRSVYFLFVRT